MHEMRHIAPVPTLRIVEGEFELATRFGTKNGQHAVGGVRDRPRQLCVGQHPVLCSQPGSTEQYYGASEEVTTVHLAASAIKMEGNHYSQVKRLESKLPAVHKNDPDCLILGLLATTILPYPPDPPESLVHGVDGVWSYMELPMRSRIARASFAVKARKLWLARPNSFGLHGKCMIPIGEWPLIWSSK